MKVLNLCLAIMCGVLTVTSHSTLALADVQPHNDGTCEGIAGRDISEPKIQIFRVKEKAPSSDGVYRLSGSIEGVCLDEAGYYERGEKLQGIKVKTTRAFQRFEFEVDVKLEDKPEIRARNVTGLSVSTRVKAAKSEAEWQENYSDRYRGLREQ